LGMSYDLGITIKSRTSFNRHLSRLDRDFDLVLITERFDESLVFLKETLCAREEDMVYSIQKKFKYDKNVLNETQRAKLKGILHFEYDLYYHFAEKLRRKMSADERFRRKLTDLRRVQETESSKCEEIKRCHVVSRDCAHLCRKETSPRLLSCQMMYLNAHEGAQAVKCRQGN